MGAPPPAIDKLVQYASMDDALQNERRLFDSVIHGGLDSASFMWSANQCLVVPLKLSHHPDFAMAAQASAASGWPVHVRQTGGGVTPQGPGIINISLALANKTDSRLSITKSYQLLCNPMIAELKQLGVCAYCASVPEAFCDGDYNTVVDGKKMVGTAQRHSRTKGKITHQAVFAHALILYKTDFEEITKQVNRLYSLMGLEQRFESSAHCSLASVCQHPDTLPSKELFSHRLMQRYNAELCSFGDSKDFDEYR